MKKSFLILSCILLMVVGAPEQVSAQEDCTFCRQCTFAPTLLELADDIVTEWAVAGDEEVFRCRTGDNGECADLIGCPDDPEEGTEEPVVEEADLIAALAVGSSDDLVNLIKAHPQQLAVIPDRDLLLLKAFRSCGGSQILSVFEVEGLGDLAL